MPLGLGGRRFHHERLSLSTLSHSPMAGLAHGSLKGAAAFGAALPFHPLTAQPPRRRAGHLRLTQGGRSFRIDSVRAREILRVSSHPKVTLVVVILSCRCSTNAQFLQ